MQGPVLSQRVSFSQFALDCASDIFGSGRRGVSRSGGNCISAAAAPSFGKAEGGKLKAEGIPATGILRFITAAAVVLMCATAAVSIFGCHPVAGLTRSHEGTKGIDFVTPNPDVASANSKL